MSLQITSSSNLQTNMPYTITGVQHYADGTKVSFSYAASNGQQLVYVAGVNVTALYPVMKAAIDEQDGAGDYCHFHCVGRQHQRQSLAVRSDCRVNNSFSDVLR